jgi:glycosyltransferase involved in cell wall biosynthesis
MPQLSVITPVYNSVQFIEACILNVIAQKCTTVEHIIIDGGSTDGTVEIVSQYALKYPHIRWVSEKDNGQSDAMNKGIKMARAEVISFLNADDAYYPYALNRIISIFKKNNRLQFITGNCKLFDIDGNLLYINRPQRVKYYHLFSYREPFPINPAAYFYHKSIHDKVGFYTIENHYTMDYEFILKTCILFDIIYFDEDWGYAIHHEDSKTLKDIEKNQMFKRKLEMFEKIYHSIPLKAKVISNLYKVYRKIKS